jgi:hypothetical protein
VPYSSFERGSTSKLVLIVVQSREVTSEDRSKPCRFGLSTHHHNIIVPVQSKSHEMPFIVEMHDAALLLHNKTAHWSAALNSMQSAD